MSLPLSPKTQEIFLQGPAGLLECAWDAPDESVGIKGVAVIAHPHPLHGGSMDNKVVHTIARALRELGFLTWRFNFRGVAQSQGQWDDGHGEADDMAFIVRHVKNLPQAQGKPLILAGFSFGAYITAKVTQTLIENDQAPKQLILIGTAVEHYNIPSVPKNSTVIHGEQDEVVSMGALMDWIRPQSIPAIIIPGAGHFFHGQLPLLKDIIQGSVRT